ncbi:MAG: transposase [Gammaproteobacteria bacterium]|nr:transposase [Gammaproteobacteria bacterium]MCH9763636.1 transposase [Gammaproteobacteria bacterium]
MSHSSDLRVRVLEYIEAGGVIKTACDTFQVSRSSIQRWRSKKEETGALLPTPRKNLPYKVDDVKLQEFISSNPDAYLNEIDEHFSITDSSAWRALTRLRITRKKSHRFIKSETK